MWHTVGLMFNFTTHKMGASRWGERGSPRARVAMCITTVSGVSDASQINPRPFGAQRAPAEPQNVALFKTRVFANVITKDEVTLVG